MKETSLEEQEFKETKVPYLRKATGFKDGDGDVPISNWLLQMEPGTIFLSYPKNPQNPLVEEYCILDKTDKSVLLRYNDHRGEGTIRVSAEVFVKQMIWLETLGKIDLGDRHG